MIKIHDDLKTRELVASISAIFLKLENLIENLSCDEAHVFTINESFELLNNYERLVPLKYMKFFLKHFDDLILDFQKKIIFNTSQTLKNRKRTDSVELINSMRFSFRSFEYLLANNSGEGKKALIINTFLKTLDEYEKVVPQKYQKVFSRRYNNLKDKISKKTFDPKGDKASRSISSKNQKISSDQWTSVRVTKQLIDKYIKNAFLPKTTPAFGPASYRYLEKSSNQTTTISPRKPVRESKWTSERDYRYFKKTTLEKTPDPFLAKRLRRI